MSEGKTVGEIARLAAIVLEQQQRITALTAEVERLEFELAQETYEHWSTCDNEGIQWYGDIPAPPSGYLGEGE